MTAPKDLRMGCYALCLAASGASAEADVQRFESPVERVTVVELFTSHGCSSCPPADDWLRRMDEVSGLWTQVVPLAFHVDYWDYLGWRDRFASADYSQRQRDYRRAGGLGSVYTPGMLVNGKEWRGWYWGRPLPDAAPSRIGQLRLEIAADGQVWLDFEPGPDWQGGAPQAHLAILGADLETRVGAGENRGRTLQESFVVLAYRGLKKADRSYTWAIDWPEFAEQAQTRYAVAAWISQGEDPTPLQAVAGWLRASMP